MKRRTELQRDADNADCDLYRVLSRVEAMYDANKRDRETAKSLGPTLQHLRLARGGLRALMHKDDRKGTEG